MEIKKNKTISNVMNKIDFEISDSGYGIIDKTWKSSDVCSPYSRLYFVESGEGFLQYRNTIIRMRAGNIYLIPAGLTFSYWCEGEMQKVFFHVNIYRPDKYDLMHGCGNIAHLSRDAGYIKHIKNLYKSKKFIDALVLKKEIFKCIVSCLDQMRLSLNKENLNYTPLIQSAMDYIERNLSIKLRCRDIARHLYISESQLSKSFKSEAGISIGKYIDDLIFFAAEKMLIKSNDSLYEISENLGFCDQFYFSRKFKQRYNETPLKYRKRMKNMQT
jgi:AraC-like DNA-binding protein